MYRIENLPPGKYKITVDSEEYQGIEEVVTIGKGGEEVPPEEESQRSKQKRNKLKKSQLRRNQLKRN